MTNRKTWRGGLTMGPSLACSECGARTELLFELDAGHSACRACVLDPIRQISVTDQRGDALHGARIARELDAQMAITLRDGYYGAAPPPLPASYRHVLAALGRCSRVDAEFSIVISELRERYQQAACFSPKQMLLSQWRLSENDIMHDPANFVVSTRSDKEIAQVRSLSDWQKKKIAPYLSWAQRSRFGF